jgi:2-methylisocitrate lyase-like PEP mutase family enzyme
MFMIRSLQFSQGCEFRTVVTVSNDPHPDQTAALAERGRRFRALHERDHPFVIPNPWDVGSARLLAAAGFEALATTSAGHAASAGVADGDLCAADTLGHVALIANATDLPVSADLEQGYGTTPEDVAATMRHATATGVVGGSIEDLDRRGGDLLDIRLAADRIVAAVEVARSLPFDFVVTARCESFGIGRPDLAATIARLQAYQAAGADVLYAPALTTSEQIAAVVSSTDRPVNVVMGLGTPTFTVDHLGELGVRRISVGSALARAAYGAFLRAVDEIRSRGTFDFADDAVPYTRLCELLADRMPATNTIGCR